MSTEHEILQRYGHRAKGKASRRSAADGLGVLQWYVVRTATNRERAAAASLAEREFVTFLPMMTRWSTLRRQTQKQAVQHPLIPGYLFVLCTLEELAEVVAVDFVHTLVCGTHADGTDRPLAFPVDVVLGLQADEARGLYDYTREDRPAYRPKKGDKIRVVAGVYLTFVGKVLSTPKGDKVHVMLEVPGGDHGKTLPVDSVQLVA